MNISRSTIHTCVLIQLHDNWLTSIETLQVDDSMEVYAVLLLQ